MPNQIVIQAQPNSTIRRLASALLLAMALWSSWMVLPAYAQGPSVTSTEPISNALNVTATSNITVTFDTEIDTATVSSQNLTLCGEQTGIYSGAYSFPATNTVVFNPASTFKPDEVLRGYASSQISSTGAISATPHVWQFTTTAQDGTGTGDVWQKQTITDTFDKASSVYAADVDGDGDLDVLGTANWHDDITWWENNGIQNFTAYTIKSNFNWALSVYATDMDGDGDLDVLGTARDAKEITWWENNGSQNFTEQTITNTFNGA